MAWTLFVVYASQIMSFRPQRLEPETRRIVDAYWVAPHHRRVGN